MNGLPPLSPGWEYHSFRFHFDATLDHQEFLMLKIESSAP